MSENVPQKVLFETALTELSSEDIEGVGTLRKDNIGRVYRWVKNRNATAFTAKQPVCYDADNVGSSALLETVNSPVTADLMLAGGIAMTAIAESGSDCYGWIQVFGYFPDARVLIQTTNDIEIGSELICVNAQTYLSYSGDAGTAPVYSSHFIALEAVATASTSSVTAKDVFIKCL